MIKHVIINTITGAKIILRDISQESSWKGVPLTYEEADGNNIYYGDNSLLKIVSYDFRNRRLLENLMRARTKVKVIVVTEEKALIWSDYITFIISSKQNNKSGTKNTITLTFQMQDGTHDILRAEVPYYLLTRSGNNICTRAGAKITINGEKAYESN